MAVVSVPVRVPGIPDVMRVGVGELECLCVGGHPSTVDEARAKVMADKGHVQARHHSIARYLDGIRWTIGDLDSQHRQTLALM